MSEVLCFTSCTLGYLDRARVLAKTFKEKHPNWIFALALTDAAPEGFVFDEKSEPFDRVLYPAEFGVDGLHAWMFGHDVVELCTAVKGPLLKKFLDEGWEKVVYLDPDIAVLSSLSPLAALLETHSILITPHQTLPETEEIGVVDNEMGALNFGVYNLGFLAVRNDENGRALAQWWRDRLLKYCHDDREKGLFVDQKWIDLAPAMFDNLHILRDPGYNVASWNLSRRRVAIRDDGVFVNGDVPLRFFHFTKMGHAGDKMTKKHAGDNVEVHEVWAWYLRLIKENAVGNLPEKWWRYGIYSNGEKIRKAERVLYRNDLSLQKRFPDPFEAGGESFLKHLRGGG